MTCRPTKIPRRAPRVKHRGDAPAQVEPSDREAVRNGDRLT
jgi:hypothetical protein